MTRTFLTAYLQMVAVSISTVMLARANFTGAFIAAFAVSMFWCNNVRRINVTGFRHSLIYSLGAACGSVTGLIVTKWII